MIEVLLNQHLLQRTGNVTVRRLSRRNTFKKNKRSRKEITRDDNFATAAFGFATKTIVGSWRRDGEIRTTLSRLNNCRTDV
jgi:hypothetical protein